MILSEDGGLVRACPQFWGAESGQGGAPSFRLGRQQQKLQTSVWSVGCAGPTKAVPIAFLSAVAFCFFFSDLVFLCSTNTTIPRVWASSTVSQNNSTRTKLKINNPAPSPYMLMSEYFLRFIKR